MGALRNIRRQGQCWRIQAHIKSVRYSEVPEGKEHCEDLHWSPSRRGYVPLWNYMLLAPISPMPNRFTPHYIIPSLKCLFIDIIVVFRKMFTPAIYTKGSNVKPLKQKQWRTVKEIEGTAVRVTCHACTLSGFTSMQRWYSFLARCLDSSVPNKASWCAQACNSNRPQSSEMLQSCFNGGQKLF